MSHASQYKSLLKKTLHRLEVAVFDEGTPPRDLASLTRRLLEVSGRLSVLNPRTAGPMRRPRRR